MIRIVAQNDDIDPLKDDAMTAQPRQFVKDRGSKYDQVRLARFERRLARAKCKATKLTIVDDR